MKKHFYVLSALLTGLFIATACSEEQEVAVANTETGEKTEVIISAAMPQADTKVEFDDTTDPTKLAVTWKSAGETFSVLTDNGDVTPELFTQLGRQSDAHTSTFSGEMVLADGTEYYAVYPRLTGATANVKNITLDMTKQIGHEYDESKVYMYAKSKYSIDDKMIFTFEHLTSILKVTLKFHSWTTVTGVTSDIKTRSLDIIPIINTITFSGEGLKPIATVDLTEEIAEGATRTYKGDDGSITLTGPFDLEKDEDGYLTTTVYLHVIPGTYSTLNVNAQDSDGNGYQGTITSEGDGLAVGTVGTALVSMDAAYTVNVTLPDDASYNYDGLEMQIGMGQQLYAASIISDNKAVLRTQILAPNVDLWFCIPGVAKYFHKITEAELRSGELTLPDKDKGSTLLADDETKNDWIVALYMGVNKNGDANNVPIYWATGNLIATKTNEANSGKTTAAFHIATAEETAKEGIKGNFPLDVIFEDETDGYVNVEKGFQWNLFGWGDPTGLMTISDDSKYAPEITLSQDISGNSKYDLARAKLGGTWRLPSGRINTDNGLLWKEFVNFDTPENNLSFVSSSGGAFSYTYTINDAGREGNNITNTLIFPLTGERAYDDGTLDDSNQGKYAYYLSGLTTSSTQYPTCVWGLNLTTNYHFCDDVCLRSNGNPIRPVTE